MAKLCTETISIDGSTKRELYFKYDINVDKDGTFSTTLPKEIVELFESSGIKTGRNRMHNKGYFTDDNFEGLKEQIKKVSTEYMSREMTVEKIIIRYAIKTSAIYAKDMTGEITPNPSEEWTAMKYGELKNTHPQNVWLSGNATITAISPSPFGFLIYAQPFVKRVYKFRSGKEYTEYTRMCYGGEIAEEYLEKGYYLRWLDSIACIIPPENIDLEELDYDEKIAEFFVDMIKSICRLNEKIKDFLKPDAIKKIAESNTKLIG